MKVINIKNKTPMVKKVAKKVYESVMRIDLIDGQKRGESIARRIILLLLLVLSLYILIDLLVDNGVLKTNNQRKVDSLVQIAPVSPVIALEQTEVAGVDNQPKTEVVVLVDTPQPPKNSVEQFVANYGGKYTPEYLASLRQYCDEDTLKLVVAISVAETSMGKNTNRKTNWYGYFYKGNRSYDPSQDEMSRVICNGISKYYSDVDTNYEKAKRYTGGDSVSTWMGNVQKALEQMR